MVGWWGTFFDDARLKTGLDAITTPRTFAGIRSMNQALSRISPCSTPWLLGKTASSHRDFGAIYTVDHNQSGGDHQQPCER